jgi:hypothetical protein
VKKRQTQSDLGKIGIASRPERHDGLGWVNWVPKWNARRQQKADKKESRPEVF